MGKPEGPESALEMLNALNGRTHRVVTGVALAREGRILDAGAVETAVTFARSRPEDLARLRLFRRAAGQGRSLCHPGTGRFPGGKGGRLLLQCHGPSGAADLAPAGPPSSKRANMTDNEQRTEGRGTPGRRPRSDRSCSRPAWLRISRSTRSAPTCASRPSALEAIEQGNYHLLPGDPVHPRPARVHVPLPGPGSGRRGEGVQQGDRRRRSRARGRPPYTDKASTYSTAHKQIFVAIVGVLFLVLFLLIGQPEPRRKRPVPARPPSAPAPRKAWPRPAIPRRKARPWPPIPRRRGQRQGFGHGEAGPGFGDLRLPYRSHRRRDRPRQSRPPPSPLRRRRPPPSGRPPPTPQGSSWPSSSPSWTAWACG